MKISRTSAVRLSAAAALTVPAFAGLAAFTAVGASAAPAAGSQSLACAQYSVAGSWTGTQDGVELNWTLSQVGKNVTGTAEYNNHQLNGTVAGTVVGNAFDAVVTWAPGTDPGAAGEYTATVAPGALQNGSGHDVNAPQYTATWSAAGTATCTTPMTKADCKDGSWQSLTDSALVAFKNQGDCVSYVATRGGNAAG